MLQIIATFTIIQVHRFLETRDIQRNLFGHQKSKEYVRPGLALGAKEKGSFGPLKSMKY